MLRTCWEKTTNPYVSYHAICTRGTPTHAAQIRALTHLPQCTVARKILLPRPRDSVYQRPVTAWLYFAGSAHELALASDLILDIPGGGFVAMSPQHHEERLRMWAVRSGKPVLAIDYGKAPECMRARSRNCAER
jgi:acetyl esterase/lipase